MAQQRRGRRPRWRRKGSERPIRYLGDPVLRTPTDPVTSFDTDLERLINDMFASMYAADGVGLAANQIGVGLSVFVYDCHDDDEEWHTGHVINPRLVSTSGEPVTDSEGCLSVPGLHFDTTRAQFAAVEGVDLHGEPIHVEGSGYFARCLQHETDHLIGKVYLDRLDGDNRVTALREVRAAQWS
jgi:peptide deformylase